MRRQQLPTAVITVATKAGHNKRVALYNHRRRQKRPRPHPQRTASQLARDSMAKRGRRLHSKSINSTSKVLKIGPSRRDGQVQGGAGWLS